MQATLTARLKLHLQDLASQPLHQGPIATVNLLETLHEALGRFGPALGLNAVHAELMAAALAQLGSAAVTSLTALPALDLACMTEHSALDKQLLSLLGQVHVHCMSMVAVMVVNIYLQC